MDIEAWYRSIPIITKWYMVSSLALSLLVNYGFVSDHLVVFTLESAVFRLNVWRLVTTFLFFPSGLLISIILIIFYSIPLEKNYFAARQADYMFMLLFGAVLFYLTGSITKSVRLAPHLVGMVLYVACQTDPERIVRFPFGLRFPAKYLPFVLFIALPLLEYNTMPFIAGYLVGHLYWFLEDILPHRTGQRLLHTPHFLIRWFAVHGDQGGVTGVRQQPRDANIGEYGHAWGPGHTLGEER